MGGTVYYPTSFEYGLIIASEGAILSPYELTKIFLEKYSVEKEIANLKEEGVEKQARRRIARKLDVSRKDPSLDKVRVLYSQRSAEEEMMSHDANKGGLVLQLEIDGEDLPSGIYYSSEKLSLADHLKEIHLSPKALGKRNEIMEAFKDHNVPVCIY